MRALVSARRERCSRWERGGGGGRRSVEGSRERNGSSAGKGIGSLSTVVQKVGSSSSSASAQKVRRRSEREKERAEREREEKGFKRFGEFGGFGEFNEVGEFGEDGNGRGVVSSGWCALRVGDGGCFGGF